MRRPGCQTCHAADMVLASGDVQFQTINDGKDLFRQRGCMGCHRYEGYDKEPEDLNSVWSADQAGRNTEEGECKGIRVPDEAGRHGGIERGSEQAE